MALFPREAAKSDVFYTDWCTVFVGSPPNAVSTGNFFLGERIMGGSQLEKALNLIDQNLVMNRDEVWNYITANPKIVVDSLLKSGRVEIPTSAGPITITREQLKVA